MNIEIAPKETEIQANWYDASQYCFSLNINEKTGWRLPTTDELTQIYESENEFEEDYYWSSTEYNDVNAWSNHMSIGIQSYYGKSYGDGYVRAVRTIA